MFPSCTPGIAELTLRPMRLPSPLLRGTLIQRYKRFLADVRLDDGQLVTATCPNTGSMMGLAVPGAVVWLSESDSPTRKYRHTWELVEADLGKGPTLVGINTGHPNKLVAEALEARRVKALAGYPGLSPRGEVRQEQPHRPPARVRQEGPVLRRDQERASVAPARARRVPQLHHRARHQAPGRAGAHGARRPPRRHGVPDPAGRRETPLARPRRRPQLRRRLRCAPSRQASRPSRCAVA